MSRRATGNAHPTALARFPINRDAERGIEITSDPTGPRELSGPVYFANRISGI
jgi:hypothetical protein